MNNIIIITDSSKAEASIDPRPDKFYKVFHVQRVQHAL